MKKRIILLMFNLILIFLNSFSNPIIFSEGNVIELGDSLEYYEDETSLKNLEWIRDSAVFTKSDKKGLNFGVSHSSFWIKFKIINRSHIRPVIEIGYPLIDTIILYQILPNNEIKKLETGEFVPFSNRTIQHPNPTFILEIPKGEIHTFYIKVKSQEQILLPLNLGSPESILNSLSQKDLIFGVYIGVILVMFLYNLFLFISTQDKSYLYYVIYIGSVGLVQACLQGYTFQLLWPSYPEIAIKSTFYLSVLVGLTAILFQKNFLQTKTNAPRLDIGLNIFIGIYLIYFLIFLLGFTNGTYVLIQATALLISLYLLYVAIFLVKKGLRSAIFFLIAWTVFLLGVIIYALKDIGFLPLNNFTYYTMQFGSAIETVLLSFALADKINTLKKEKQESQAQALEALQETERLVKQQNVILEQKVEDRTTELRESNKELGAALKDLKEAQSQLVQSEKMASLGQLTAGVAHEINNPINFVSSSIKPLRRDINDLLSVLNEYDLLSKENFDKKIEEIKGLKDGLDVAYLKEEIDSLLKGIDEGATRTAEIVKGLRTFSRIDEADLKRVDLQEGLDSTLILLASMMRGVIVVEKDYEKIPLVECYAGKMNQVFMNILNNAIHAVLKKNPKEGEGKITIKTFERNDKVFISIKDNGTGMPEEVRKKIFDPFFTTKEIGEGTGLGLSIVYNIIESHKGKIEVYSEAGVGTEFLIELPKIYTDTI